ARPTVAFATQPGPKVPWPALKPSRSTASPWTITSGATGPVVAWTPARFASGRHIARTAARTTGKTSGGQPAISALIATTRSVARPSRGGTMPTSASGRAPLFARKASRRAFVGTTIGRPSPQPRSASARLTSSGSSDASVKPSISSSTVAPPTLLPTRIRITIAASARPLATGRRTDEMQVARYIVYGAGGIGASLGAQLQ